MNNLSEIELANMEQLSFDHFKNEVLNDYKTVCISRETSLLGRKEVLTGKAKFGIFGDGKEVAQVALAKFFKPGDFRSGYYRDQTLMFATGMATVEQYFSQLFSDPNINHDPFSAGRQMNAHFATPFVDENGEWLDLVNSKNCSSDISPTAGQMVRGLGLSLASKLFRKVDNFSAHKTLSNNGNEVCFCTIGDASTSEGHFWEVINAAAVQQVPLAVFVWDDGYGISVPKHLQTAKGSVSQALSGMEIGDGNSGINIYKLKGWDYAGMCEVLEPAIQKIRDTHTPAIFHVEEITQPQGHSTSGSHERYKTQERLDWEREWDCLPQMRIWLLANSLATEEELAQVEQDAKVFVRDKKNSAWQNFIQPILQQCAHASAILRSTLTNIKDDQISSSISAIANELDTLKVPLRKDVMRRISSALRILGNRPEGEGLRNYFDSLKDENAKLFNSFLYNEGPKSALSIGPVAPQYAEESKSLNGYEVLNQYFDALFTNNNKVVAFGEDVGHIGDVNQGFSGLQEKHGTDRIFDTGIRELSIMGQGIGLALRGLRPIAEIQYLDYLLYGLQPLSDDAATTHFRTFGRQSCPIIVRTRGHRLEGVWHSGSPMGVILNALRGMHVCVPRNMVQAIGMYNTLLASNDPGLMIECLNGYRLKETAPDNLLSFRVPLGIPETIRSGEDITIVGYGSTLRIISEAAEILEQLNVSCEIIDVQTLLPFDINHHIVKSLQRTSRILFVDEDVPGGAAAFMFNKVMEEQGGYKWLDVAPRTLTAQAHRPTYGSDGDYFSKPNTEDVISVVIEMMAE